MWCKRVVIALVLSIVDGSRGHVTVDAPFTYSFSPKGEKYEMFAQRDAAGALRAYAVAWNYVV